MNFKHCRPALQISLIYCAVAAAWIVCSDRLVLLLLQHPKEWAHLQTAKGLGFVGVTTLVLYVAARWWLRQRDQHYVARQSVDANLADLARFPEEDPQAVLRVREDGMILYANRIGKSLMEHCRIKLGEPLPSEWRQQVRRALESRQVEETDKDCGDRRFHFVLVPFPLNNYVNIYGQDVTERKQAEAVLQLQAAALNATANAVVITDTQGTIQWANPAATVITGYSLTELLGQNPRVLKSGRHSSEFYQKLWSTVARGEVWSGKMVNRRKNGTDYHEEMTITPVRNTEGAIKHFVAIKQDVTSRVQAELELERREAEFRLLIENASDLITVVNGQGVVRYQSPSGERLMGYAAHEFAGRNVFDFVHPDDVSHATSVLQRALTEPNVTQAAEYRFRHRDGTWRVLQSMGRNVPDQSSEGFIIVNSRDVTETRKLEEQYRQIQKMEAFGQLAGGVAHDFNNILAVIMLQAGMLRTGNGQLLEVGSLAQEISKAAERGANLTRQLLLFSRRQMLQPCNLDLNEVVSNVTKMLRRIVGEDIRMQLKFSENPMWVRADAGMIDQVLMNLAVNSRDAMPKGGDLLIETSAIELDEFAARQSAHARTGSFVRLSVTDTGGGIAPQILPRVFEPFFTTKDVGKGTGLGLATVFGIVQQHHGWVNVYSEVGLGTTFRIYLPRVALEGRTPTDHGAEQPLPGGQETILIVEDEAGLRQMVEGALTRLGYRVLSAETAASAVRLWNQNRGRIQVLLTDMVMPGGTNGRELAQQLQSEQPELKVIYSSGYSVEITGGDLKLEEGINFIRKPFDLHQLAGIVRHRLDN